MTNELNAISDGTYTLSESKDKKYLYFFRNDGKVLTDIDEEPMDLYHAYITKKMMDGEIEGAIAQNICTEISDDEKCIRLTVEDISIEKIEDISSKRQNFLTRLFKKIFR